MSGVTIPKIRQFGLSIGQWEFLGLVQVSLNSQFQVLVTLDRSKCVQIKIFIIFAIFTLHKHFTLYIYYIRQIKVCANYNIYNIFITVFQRKHFKNNLLGNTWDKSKSFQLTTFMILTIFTIVTIRRQIFFKYDHFRDLLLTDGKTTQLLFLFLFCFGFYCIFFGLFYAYLTLFWSYI